jgi:two pore calcium channel protein 3
MKSFIIIIIIRKLKYPNNDEYFTNYIDTVWDLYVLTTTANNPDVM